MKLQEPIRQALDNKRGYALIMLALGCSHSTARDYIKNNKRELTLPEALKAIREETGLSEEDIMEEDIDRVEKCA